MVNGTFRMRASVWASSVLPEPVGPISRMLLFAARRRVCGEVDPLEVVVDRDGQRPLGALLPDHVLAEDLDDLLRLGQRLRKLYWSAG